MNALPFSTVISILTIVNVCLTDNEKVWKFNTNFDNQENWERGELPCKTSIVVFPADAEVPVEIPTKISSLLEIRRIVLSRQGSLIFPSNSGGITLSSEDLHASCPGGEVKFTRTERKRWADPSNWLNSNEATPHLERIPCAYDTAVFPGDKSFFVELPNRPVTVSSVNVQGSVFAHSIPWGEFLEAEQSFKMFGDSKNIEVTGERCRNADGCDCGNSYLYSDVCTGKWKWKPPQCANPVTPIGFCFPICGAFLLYKDGSEAEIRRGVDAFVKSKNVVSHTSKTNGFVQIVLVDSDDYYGYSSEIPGELHAHLLKGGFVKSTIASVQASGLRINSIEASAIFQRFLFAFFCSLLLFGAIFCTYDRNWLAPFTWDRFHSLWSGASDGTVAFARFENATGTVEISKQSAVQSKRYRPKPAEDERGFKNPMFSEDSLASGSVLMSKLDRRRSLSDSERSDISSGTDSTTHDDPRGIFTTVNIVKADEESD